MLDAAFARRVPVVRGPSPVTGCTRDRAPTWRIDHMPYGGVEDSGLGREGPRNTIEEMSEPKLLVINRQLT